MLVPYILVTLLLAAAAGAATLAKKLTPAAAITGVGVAEAVYAGGGFAGLILLALFFLLGTMATSWKKEKKLGLKGNAAHESTRTPGQVIANGGVAALAGIGALLFPQHKPLFLLMMAAGLSSATADTLSSELGMVYGRRFYHLLTFKPDERGLDGVVSLEGTGIGIAGSILIAAAFVLTTQTKLYNFIIVLAAGTLGNLLDSVLGAVLERKGIITNNTVNFLNTLAAALFALALY
jgi:uncharacterized protein (TIGR00297 family)